MNYEAVIGIETHVELLTRSKLFCGCPVDFTADPNTNVCPVCLGLPGALPVPNRRAIEWIMAIGLALNSRVAGWSQFHRKNYFYADQPKNYQISQFDAPVCVGGTLVVEVDGEPATVGINRVHLEEDTAKMIHVGGGGRIHAADHSLLDFNRAGIPLVEIVTEPDLRTPQQARAYVQELQALVLALGVSDAKLEEGSMRFDANISLRSARSSTYGTKVEVKNMNSFRSLERALAFEIERQTKALQAGEVIVQETRHWDEQTGITTSGRAKEESSDYRYFPEPDLVPIEVSDEWLAGIRAALPELPVRRRTRYRDLGVDAATAATLASAERGLTELFEESVAGGADPQVTANWLTGEVVAYLRRARVDVSALPLEGRDLVELSTMMTEGELSATAAKQVLGAVLAGEGRPRQVAVGRDLLQISDEAALAGHVDRVLADHPDEYRRLLAGDQKVAGFLVGQVMRSTGGKADPKLVSRLIRDRASA